MIRKWGSREGSRKMWERAGGEGICFFSDSDIRLELGDKGRMDDWRHSSLGQ